LELASWIGERLEVGRRRSQLVRGDLRSGRELLAPSLAPQGCGARAQLMRDRFHPGCDQIDLRTGKRSISTFFSAGFTRCHWLSVLLSM
jgi:hypothetical protein